jgi:hypothetical protein
LNLALRAKRDFGDVSAGAERGFPASPFRSSLRADGPRAGSAWSRASS